MMKVACRLLILCVLFVGMTAVPCFAAEFAISQGLKDDNPSPFVDNGRPCLSEAQQSGEALIDEEILNNGKGIIVSQAEGGAEKEGNNSEKEGNNDYVEEEAWLEEEGTIADPIEPVNRAFFHFNDKLYFWLLKPVAQGYSAVVPEGGRISLRNVFDNITTPIRFVNCLLQLKVKSAGIELLRFGYNTTIGFGGIADVAKNDFGLVMKDEDFGQTVGKVGFGPGFYICWPILGPSSLRDTIGDAGDYFLDPLNYVHPTSASIEIKAGDRVNRTSLMIGDYEYIKDSSLDPYIAIRDAYNQHRKRKISQ